MQKGPESKFEALPEDLLNNVLQCYSSIADGRDLANLLPVCRTVLRGVQKLRLSRSFKGDAQQFTKALGTLNGKHRAFNLDSVEIIEKDGYRFTNGQLARLKDCPALHTLNMSNCDGVTDVSALGQCVALHTLNMSNCWGVTDVSVLGQCEALHTLNLGFCMSLKNVSALAGCANLHTLNMTHCSSVTDVSALGQCVALHTLNMSNCWGVTDVSALAGCANLHTLDIDMCFGGVFDSTRSFVGISVIGQSTGYYGL